MPPTLVQLTDDNTDNNLIDDEKYINIGMQRTYIQGIIEYIGNKVYT